MVELNYVIRDLTVAHEGLFDLKTLYKIMKGWFDLHRFDFYEREYVDVLNTDAKDIRMKWEAERKVDDYTKFAMEVKINIKNHKIAEIKKNNKKAKLSSAKLKVEFTSYLKNDYEDKWEGPLKRFTRGIYDKFISKSKYDRYEEELKEETYNIFNEVKAFLNLQKFE